MKENLSKYVSCIRNNLNFFRFLSFSFFAEKVNIRIVNSFLMRTNHFARFKKFVLFFVNLQRI